MKTEGSSSLYYSVAFVAILVLWATDHWLDNLLGRIEPHQVYTVAFEGVPGLRTDLSRAEVDFDTDLHKANESEQNNRHPNLYGPVQVDGFGFPTVPQSQGLLDRTLISEESKARSIPPTFPLVLAEAGFENSLLRSGVTGLNYRWNGLYFEQDQNGRTEIPAAESTLHEPLIAVVVPSVKPSIEPVLEPATEASADSPSQTNSASSNEPAKSTIELARDEEVQQSLQDELATVQATPDESTEFKFAKSTIREDDGEQSTPVVNEEDEAPATDRKKLGEDSTTVRPNLLPVEQVETGADQSKQTLPIEAIPASSSSNNLIMVAEPVAVQAALEALSQYPSSKEFADLASQAIADFRSEFSGSSDSAFDALNRLRNLSEGTTPTAVKIDHETMLVLEAKHELLKRAEVWEAIKKYRDSSNSSDAKLTPLTERDYQAIQSHIQDIDRKLGTATGAQAWRQYLLLSEMRSTFSQDVDETSRRKLARRVIGRMNSARLGSQQLDFLNQPEFVSLRSQLGHFAQETVSINEVLEKLELYEAGYSQFNAVGLANSIESLGYSDDPIARELAGVLEANYRNSNLRFTVSEELMNRILPKPQPVQENVRDHLLGARVIGTSNTVNRIRVNLIPDDRRLTLGLEADGTVHSRTHATKQGFTFHNLGQARFRANKFLSLDRRGFSYTHATAEATSEQQTTDVESDYDGLPIFGAIARSIAMQEKEEQDSAAKRIVEEKVAQTAEERMDSEIHSKLVAARDKLQNDVIGPLDSLGLDPRPIEMRTTEERMVVRYRLAGRDQLSATTARPQAMANSLMSFQLHETAINNFLTGLELEGRTFELQDLGPHLTKRLGRPIALGQEVEEDVSIVFPESDWLKFRFDDNKVNVTLRFAQLKIGRRKPFKNIEVTATYFPEIRGRQLVLARPRESTLELSGTRLSIGDQVILRSVLNSMFAPDQKIEVIPTKIADDPRLVGTEITQLIIQNGWVGVSVSDVAVKRPEQAGRITRKITDVFHDLR